MKTNEKLDIPALLDLTKRNTELIQINNKMIKLTNERLDALEKVVLHLTDALLIMAEDDDSK